MKKGFLLLILILLLVGGCIYFYAQLLNLEKKLASSNYFLKKTESELEFTKKKLDSAIHKYSITTQQGEKDYSFEEFGWYSPFFEGQTIATTDYWYAGSTIQKKSIQYTSQEQLEYSWNISIWQVSENVNLPDMTQTHISKVDFPIFSGYEGGYFWLSEFLSSCTYSSEGYSCAGKEQIITAQGYRAYRNYSYAPKHIAGVNAYIYETTSLGNQSLIEIFVPVYSDGLVSQDEAQNHPAVLAAKQKLTDILDSLSKNKENSN